MDRAALAELERLAQRFPPGMKYRIAFDTTEVVSESIHDVIFTLAVAIALVILVIFVFLEDWRTTLIPAVTIPVSLIGTFAFVKLLGFSINTLTLFGITLATGPGGGRRHRGDREHRAPHPRGPARRRSRPPPRP